MKPVGNFQSYPYEWYTQEPQIKKIKSKTSLNFMNILLMLLNEGQLGCIRKIYLHE